MFEITEKKKQPEKATTDRKTVSNGIRRWIGGIFLTLAIALLAMELVRWPVLSFTGPMLLSILLGMTVRHFIPVITELQAGFAFSSKTLLRTGIVLLGLRLNLHQIAAAGVQILAIDMIVIAATFLFMWWLGKRLNVETKMRALISTGTAICGAAAIVAVAPVLRAPAEKVATAVAYIAITGTVFAIGYSIFFVAFHPDPALYGALVGSTLHEVAHVVAAGAVSGAAGADMAILVKLGRVLLLVPVVFLLLWIFKPATKNVPIPWFIFLFLGMSAFQTFIPISAMWTEWGIQLSTLFLAMGMAGLGLGVNFSTLKEGGRKMATFSVLGTVGIVIVGIVSVLLGLS